jgi:selenoprotein W-related protein
LIAGRGGIFDVEVEGELIFSKHEVGRFPEDSEILEKLG